jgi:cobaltochelatase CobN
VLADVLINTQIMLNADERREEFERLGFPVIQAMTHRRGDEADWAASRQGVARWTCRSTWRRPNTPA